jgi:hypothetical protein
MERRANATRTVRNIWKKLIAPRVVLVNEQRIAVHKDCEKAKDGFRVDRRL